MRATPPTAAARKAIVDDLARCVVFALTHFGKHEGVIVKNIGLKPKKLELKTWQDEFMDALDAYGFCVDRKAYFANLAAATKKRKRQ